MPQLDPDAQREFAADVVRRLREAGHEAYWAGGCVRDRELGVAPKDYDVATDAQPPAIREIFGRRRTLEIGAAFGVVAVIGPRGAGQVEVTTFRRDSAYSDGRRPDDVTFSTAIEDARRRDFTINGMYYDPVAEQVIDYVGGKADLAAGIVRAIGDPAERFGEDKLRMLRAIRFAAKFDFALDPATKAAISRMAMEIGIVSAERIAQEMRGMLTGPRRGVACRLLQETNLLAAVLPETAALEALQYEPEAQPANADVPVLGGVDVWEHSLTVLDALSEPSFPLALAGLLHDVGKPHTAQRLATRSTSGGPLATPHHAEIGSEIVNEIARRWRLSNDDRTTAAWLVRRHHDLRFASTLPWSQLQPVLVAPAIAELLALDEAHAKATDGPLDEVEFCRAQLARPAHELNPIPLVTGNDLLRHGVPQGKAFTRLLSEVRTAQLDGRIRDQAEALALVDRLLAEDAQ